ncbi:hypothetical protein BpHYR1_023673 [Brachionus plicatilis]|uniref:Uncharacterized protein n=1 Tax=Brachionus plicatilis TaxID=10195 RepID=A0A3M7QXL7_BRAPC|nr:hypothetical protein BpHYR1_023673 [Brachionus plicatilis]
MNLQKNLICDKIWSRFYEILRPIMLICQSIFNQKNTHQFIAPIELLKACLTLLSFDLTLVNVVNDQLFTIKLTDQEIVFEKMMLSVPFHHHKGLIHY